MRKTGETGENKWIDANFTGDESYRLENLPRGYLDPRRDTMESCQEYS